MLVGVYDDGSILGLDSDYQTFGRRNPKDSFLLRFDSLIKENLGKENLAYIVGSIEKLNEYEILVVSVLPSNKPVFVNLSGKDDFFIRGSASSLSLSMKETIEYIQSHWES